MVAKQVQALHVDIHLYFAGFELAVEPDQGVWHVVEQLQQAVSVGFDLARHVFGGEVLFYQAFNQGFGGFHQLEIAVQLLDHAL